MRTALVARERVDLIDDHRPHAAQQLAAARQWREAYQRALQAEGHGDITTEVEEAPSFYYAEDYHQQYLAKNPNGYCGIGGTGVACPVGIAVS